MIFAQKKQNFVICEQKRQKKKLQIFLIFQQKIQNFSILNNICKKNCKINEFLNRKIAKFRKYMQNVRNMRIIVISLQNFIIFKHRMQNFVIFEPKMQRF